jgi:type IV pilus assembly protein PilW
MTLIELMVAMLIGLLLTLAMISALSFGEAQKRTTAATTDVDQSGAFAASALDTALRGAGSGLMQATPGVLGCNLPGLAGAAPSIFGNGHGMGALGVAPVLIAAAAPVQGAAAPASDVLVVMGGSGAAGGVARAVKSASGARLQLNNTVGIEPGSLALLDNQPGGCAIQSIADAAAGVLTLDAAPAGVPASVLPLGNPAAGDVAFQLLGVDTATHALVSFDLLSRDSALAGKFASISATPRPISDNVLVLQALYGVADAGTGRLARWVAPTGGYAMTSLLASPSQLSRIVAIRVALVLKGSLYEKDPVEVPPLTWFNPDPAGTAQDKGIAVTWMPDDLHYRYRVIEFVAPVRNSLMAINPP